MKKYISILFGIILIYICGCTTVGYEMPKILWDNEAYWYQDTEPIDENKVDVFYVLSTSVISSKDEKGNSSPRVLLTQEERDVMAEEMRWFRNKMFTKEFNYFSPYYHQVTFESLGNPRGGRSPLWDAAADEVCDAFDYYMAHKNHGRRFILAGYSQGASIIREIVKRLNDEEYSRFVAAYSIGFQVTEDDLKSPRIVPAKSDRDTGVIISFNSVIAPDKKWDLVSGDAACSINPVNWRTDAEPVTFEVNGANVTATLDTTNHLVIVSGFEPTQKRFSGMCPPGNLHLYDRTLYINSLRKNAILRAYKKEENELR